MGTACGCTHEPPEYEVATIDLAKTPFAETPDPQLAIPMVDLEQEFINIINEIKLDNALVNVYIVSVVRKYAINKAPSNSTPNPISHCSIC
jgi:hypothetical protein